MSSLEDVAVARSMQILKEAIADAMSPHEGAATTEFLANANEFCKSLSKTTKEYFDTVSLSNSVDVFAVQGFYVDSRNRVWMSRTPQIDVEVLFADKRYRTPARFYGRRKARIHGRRMLGSIMTFVSFVPITPIECIQLSVVVDKVPVIE